MNTSHDHAGPIAPMLTERRAVLLGLMAPMAVAGAAQAADRSPASLYRGERQVPQGRTMEQAMRELVDREEIRDLIALYAHRVAQGISIADLYTDDGIFIVRYPDRPVSRVEGRRDLDKLFTELANGKDHPMPMIHNILLRIEGDRGVGTCSNELRWTENGQSMIGSGYYEDEFRREGGVWKFVSRDMTFFHWVPIQEGWAGQTS